MTQPLVCSMLLAVLSLTTSRYLIAADPAEIASPPDWIKPAFHRGHVTVEFSDPTQKPRDYPGWTKFESKLTYLFHYEYQTETAPEKKLAVTLTPKFKKLNWEVHHQIQLPEHLQTPRVWEAPLARHELDHVGIGAHHRLALLADHLVRKIQRIERTVEKGSLVDRAWAELAIRDEITPRREAIDELIKANNRKLDKLTGHGQRGLEDHEAFFSTMYLKENLDEMKFPYLAEVRELLTTREYQAAHWTGQAKPENKPDH